MLLCDRLAKIKSFYNLALELKRRSSAHFVEPKFSAGDTPVAPATTSVGYGSEIAYYRVYNNVYLTKIVSKLTEI